MSETMGEALQEFFKDRTIRYDRQTGWVWHTTGYDGDFDEAAMTDDEIDDLLYLLDHDVNGDWPQEFK